MSAAEYVVIFSSIVLGLALSAILINLDRLLRQARKVRWDWAPPLLAIVVVLLLVQVWWSLFPGEDAQPTTIGGFLPQLGLLVLLFLLAGAVLPSEVPDEGLNLKAYYQANGPYFWSLMTATLGWVAATNAGEALVRGEPVGPVLAGRWVDLVILALFASLIVVRNRWWHAVVIAVAMIGPIGWLSRSVG